MEADHNQCKEDSSPSCQPEDSFEDIPDTTTPDTMETSEKDDPPTSIKLYTSKLKRTS